MQSIWKVELPIGACTHELPAPARVLSAKEQHGLVDPAAPKATLGFLTVPTGGEHDDILSRFTFVDTVLTSGGALVWHVFVAAVAD